MVAIDFTQSNGKPTDPTSLHFLDGRRVVENPYTMAIRTIGDIFQDYDAGNLSANKTCNQKVRRIILIEIFYVRIVLNYIYR